MSKRIWSFKKRALNEIFSNPLKHLAVTIPVALKGMYVLDDADSPAGNAVCLMNFLLFFSLFFLFIKAIVHKNTAVTAFLLPAVFSFLFYSFLTHNITRYNVPLIPVLWASTTIIVFGFFKRHSHDA